MNDKNNDVQVKLCSWLNEHWYEIILNTDKGEVTDYYPSVSTILNIVSKPFLAHWRGDIGNREADLKVWEAQESGKRTHNAWYTFNTGGVVVYSPWDIDIHTSKEIEAVKAKYGDNYALLRYQEEMYDVYKLQRWVDIVKPEFLYSEHIVYSYKLRAAGTLDNVVFIKGGTYYINGSKPVTLRKGWYVLDLKTGSGVYDEHYMQLAAYKNFFEEMGLGKIIGAIIIHTSAKTRSGIPGLATYIRKPKQMKQDYKDFQYAKKLWVRNNKSAAPKLFDFPSLIAQDIPIAHKPIKPKLVKKSKKKVKKSTKKGKKTNANKQRICTATPVIN